MIILKLRSLLGFLDRFSWIHGLELLMRICFLSIEVTALGFACLWGISFSSLALIWVADFFNYLLLDTFMFLYFLPQF
ncbi:hypothetical protein ES288_D13G062400v1 [Gossypium darwinii]|uniref:Uncharacterized protein n=1 Tax=Gossypium darwinii TaxID=34276 RepID=A0A5D1ZXJ4_GOSDA|nr:hypothetical protein ES288_D13G062400v1 [Gossypium darwinii]